MIPRGMIPGTRTQPLDVAGAQVVDLICFDVALTNPLPRKSGTAARWVTVQTSNGHLHRDRAAPTAVHDQSGAGHGDRTDGGGRRSEEHTSELQSLMRISYAVFCLKKKNVLLSTITE